MSCSLSSSKEAISEINQGTTIRVIKGSYTRDYVGDHYKGYSGGY